MSSFVIHLSVYKTVYIHCNTAVNFHSILPSPLIFDLLTYTKINPSSKLCELGITSIQKDSLCLLWILPCMD